MRCCKICPSTAIVGVMALAGLGWAGFTTMTGRCPLTGRCQTEAAAATTVANESEKGGCCPLTEGAEGTMMNASLAEGEAGCETACDDACKTACESACTGEKSEACTGDKSEACTDKPAAPIASDAPAGPTGG